MPTRAATLLIALAAVACTRSGEDRERRAEVERARAEAEGAAPAGQPAPRMKGAPVAITRAPPAEATDTSEPPNPGVTAWAAAIGRDLDTLDRRSRQLLTVQLLREARDPLQKTRELVASMQWCDEGSLEACLRVGHVLVFNECLFDRGRGFYEKAAALADTLAPPALDHLTVDGAPRRQELRAGLRYSDPANRADEQVRALSAVCGAIAERDRPLWDEMFARYAAGEVTPAASSTGGRERLSLGMLRRKLLFDEQDVIEALASLHAGTAQGLRVRLASVANDLCAEGDAVSCAAASFLHARRCDLAQVKDAYRRYQSALDGLDADTRAQAIQAGADVIGPARALVEGDVQRRDLMLRSLCGGRP